MKFRITFTNSQTDKHKSYDIDAKDSNEAFKIAYTYSEAKSREYTDVSVEEHPTGPSPIGISFIYKDTVNKKDYHGCIIIKAFNEESAVNYYNAHYKGKRFWFDSSKPEPDGKHIYGEVIETYFAACPGYAADATI